MSKILGIAKKQYSAKLAEELQSFAVPQWLDDNGKPIQIYFRPSMKLSQRSQIVQHYVDKELDKAMAKRVIFQARDENGKRLFEIGHLDQIIDEFDPEVVQFICEQFEKAEPKQEEISKN